MRVKTEEKRQKIIEIAGALFLERGFGDLSMADISTAVGGSKATLYNYFKSKEEIFVAVMLAKARKLAEKAFSVLDHDLPLEKKIYDFGCEYLAFILSQDMIDMKRRVIAQADKVEIGPQVYECGIKQGWGRISNLFESSMKNKKMTKGDPWIAAMQLKALLEADIYIKRLMSIEKRINKKAIPPAVEEALKVFWSYYRAKP